MFFKNPLKLRAFVVVPLVMAFSLAITINASATQFYLEDADTTVAPAPSGSTPSIAQHQWPRIMMAETQSFAGDQAKYSKYQMIATSAGTINKIEALQNTYPDLMYMRSINPNEYLGYNNETSSQNCIQSHGNAFSTTTSSSGDTSGGNCGVYAGHWLYRAGSRSTNSLTATSTSLKVQDATRFTNGEFIVIYNTPAGSFNNAEHAKVVGRNTSTNTLTLQRGFKSNGVAHATGSIVAQHARGHGVNNPQNWAYNLSTQSPTDANNRRYNQFLPIWLKQNVSRNMLGETTTANVSGILFDADFAFLTESIEADVNNDLVVDDGISSGGVNWWGDGMDQFYANARTQFPNLILSGGVRDSRGFSSLNGTQMEGFPGYTDFHSPDPEYNNLAALLNKYTYSLRQRTRGPAHSHVLSKTPSNLYPFNSPRPSSNRTFRFSLGMTLLEDGFFGFRNTSEYQDVWFDEYAVDVTSGSATYGQAVDFKTNTEAKVRANRGWLGRPSSARKRVYSDSEFAAANAKFSSTFNTDINDWEGQNVNISRTSSSANVQDGAGALQIGRHSGGYQKLFSDASAKGPKVPVVKGRTYTYVFSTKASSRREISVAIGGHGERFTIGPKWQRHVMTFTAEQTVDNRASFNVGRENSDVWIDTVHLFEGNANVFRRDFDRGIVIVNATPNSRTVQLNGTFQRIQGSQDNVNNGAIISSVTLAPHDSALLLRLENQQPSGDTQPPSITINAPTKTKVGTITNTTIVVRDALAINANGIGLASDNTAGVSNLNCTQTNTTQVNCTLNITRSGDLSITADDVAGNRALAKEVDYTVNGGSTGDGAIPNITVTAPTKSSSSAITNTTLEVTDNEQLRAQDVVLRSNNTAGVQNFNCVQTNSKLVRCTMRIVSSGDLRLMATDVAGNVHLKSETGYQVNGGSGTPDTQSPYFLVSTPTRSSNGIIRDTTIEVRDDVGIRAVSVRVRGDTTLRWRAFSCSQIDDRKVRCTIEILSSGNLKLEAADQAGNITPKSVNGYRINKNLGALLMPTIMVLLE